MAFQKKLPTSVGAVKSGLVGSARTGMFVVYALLGIGAAFLALPFLKRIPIIGGILSAGQAALPGQNQQMTVDQWGRVR